MRFFWQKKKKPLVFHIGYKRIDGKDLISQDVHYFFFNTKSFVEEDDILGMWQRIFHLLPQKKPTIILLQLHKPNMVNEHEFKELLNFGIVLKLSNV